MVNTRLGTGSVTPIVSTGRPPTDSQGGRIVQDRERDEATRTKEAGGQRSSVYIGQVRKQERQNMIYNDAAADSFSAATYLCKDYKKKRKEKRATSNVSGQVRQLLDRRSFHR